MSTYTIERCNWREAAALPDKANLERVISEHEEAATSAADPETARIARGFALIARRRLADERWRADAYKRLARGEDISHE